MLVFANSDSYFAYLIFVGLLFGSLLCYILEIEHITIYNNGRKKSEEKTTLDEQ